MTQTFQFPLATKATHSSQISQSVSHPSDLDRELVEALDNARTVSQQQGLSCPAVAVAWDIVEEILVAKFRQQTQYRQTPFEQYCLAYPDAPESRIYDV